MRAVEARHTMRVAADLPPNSPEEERQDVEVPDEEMEFAEVWEEEEEPASDREEEASVPEQAGFGMWNALVKFELAQMKEATEQQVIQFNAEVVYIFQKYIQHSSCFKDQDKDDSQNGSEIEH